MKHLKLLAAILVAGILAFSAINCGGGGNDSSTEAETDLNPEVTTPDTEPGTIEPTVDPGTTPTDTQDTSSPAIVSISPANHSSIKNTQNIVIKFSKTIDPATLALNGSLADESDDVSWSTTDNENDTLTIAPLDAWTIGTTHTLKIDCKDSAGNQLVSSTSLETSPDIMFGIQIVYMHPSTLTKDEVAHGMTDLKGEGTLDSPMADFNEAIGLASDKLTSNEWSTSAQVHAMAGTYYVLSGTSHVYMLKRVSILGGFSNEDWTVRDLASYRSQIEDVSRSGGTSLLPNRAIEVAALQSDETIDGFMIVGGGGSYAAAIYNHSGATPRIANNTIVSGTATGINSAIFNYDNTSAHIYNNSIYANAHGQQSAAIYNHTKSSPTIEANWIHAGSGSNYSFGIYNAETSSPLIFNNTIDGGDSANSSVGIYAQKYSSPQIYNNTIDCGSAPTCNCIRTLYYSNPSVINNIFFPGDGDKCYAYYEATKMTTPEVFINNDLFELSYFDSSSVKTFSKIDEINKLLATETNISANPNFAGIAANNWHLTSSSPKSVKGGGDASISSMVRVDKDGNKRTPPYSMGAYEYDL